ncbi:MAG TPA: hypothetical protein VKP65_17250 [Rhodothermales bacterium]|nr:hypothetical protein [Rhodothermales bacterium]
MKLFFSIAVRAPFSFYQRFLLKYMFLSSRFPVLLLLILFSMRPSPSSAQDRQQNASSLFLLPQGNALSSLSGSGFGNIVQLHPSDVATGNPAALTLLTQPSIAVSLQYGTTIDNAWIESVNWQYSRLNDVLPQSAGMVYPYKGWRLGLGYAQHYSANNQRGPIQVTTETSDLAYYSLEETRLHAVEPALAYTQEGILSPRDAWTIGIRAGLHLFTHDTQLDESYFKWNLHSPSWTIGTSYVWHTNDNRYVRAGLFYQDNVTLEGKASSFSKDVARIVLLPGSNSENPATVLIEPPAIQVAWPARLGGGVSGEPLPGLTLSAEVQRVFWQQAEEQYHYKDQTEFSVNAHYAFSKAISGTIAFHQAGRDYPQDIRNPEVAFFGFDDAMQARYLALGGVVQWSNLQLDLAVADSHLFSSEKNQQTLLEIGLAVMF